MSKPGKKPKHAENWAWINDLAWRGLTNEEIVGAMGISRATFFRVLAQGDRRERLRLAREDAARYETTLAYIGRLALAGKPAAALQQFYKLIGPR